MGIVLQILNFFRNRRDFCCQSNLQSLHHRRVESALQTRIAELHFQKRKPHCAKHWRMVSFKSMGVLRKKLDILVLGGCKINLVVAAVASFLTYPVSCSVWLVGCDRSLQAAFISVAVSPMSNEEAMVEARHGPGTPQIHEFSNGWKSYTQATPCLRH